MNDFIFDDDEELVSQQPTLYEVSGCLLTRFNFSSG